MTAPRVGLVAAALLVLFPTCGFPPYYLHLLGTAFLLATLACAEIGRGVALNWERVTGGGAGLVGIPAADARANGSCASSSSRTRRARSRASSRWDR